MIRRRWTRAIAASLSAVFLAALAVVPAPCAAADEPINLQTLADQVSGRGRTASERAAAAANLAAIRTPAAATILVDALNSSDTDVSAAAAKSLSETNWTDATFINPLESLLGPSQTLNTYAADALSQYAGNTAAPDIAERLEAVASADEFSSAARAPAVRALGSFGEKPVAQTLMNLLQDPAQGDDVREAAAMALAEMTGMSQFGQDAGKWQAWWQSVQNLSPDDLSALMQGQRGAHFAEVVRQSDRLGRSLDRLLKSLYFTSSVSDQPRVLDAYLTNDAPEVRRIGAQIVEIDVSGGRPLQPAARARLIQMVADDPSPDVRAAAAATLGLDPTAADILFDRLDKETDSTALAALLDALAARQDPRAIAADLRFLRDPSPLLAQAAADSLAPAGTLLREARFANLEQQVESALLSQLGQSSASPGLRRSITSALAALGDMNLYDRFVQLSSPNEPTSVRIEAIAGLGVLAQANADIAAVLADFVDAPGTPAPLRLEAVRDLGMVHTTAYVDRLVDRLNRTPDPDPDIRQAVWQTVQNWLPLLDDDRLSRLAERLKRENDLAREVDVRRFYVQQLSLRKTADAAQMAASQRETIASRELDDLHRPSDAAADFAAVVNFYLSKARPGEDLPHNPFIGQTAALLAAGPPYDAAVKFAADTLADPNRNSVVPDVLEQFPRVAGDLATSNPRDRASLNKALQLVQTFNAAKLNIPSSLSYVTDNLQAAASAATQNLANLGPPVSPP